MAIGFLGSSRGHGRLRTLLSAYINDQVAPCDARRVEEHLSGCEACRLELSTLRATVGLLRGLPQVEPLRSFTLTEKPAMARPAPGNVWAAAIATSVASLLLIALLLGDVVGVVTQAGEEQETALATPAITAAAPRAALAPQAGTGPEAAAAQQVTAALADEASPSPGAQQNLAATTPAPATPPTSSVQPLEQESAVAASETPALVSPPGDQGTQKAYPESKGLMLPLWQLEASMAGLLATLALVTVVVARRSLRRRGPPTE